MSSVNDEALALIDLVADAMEDAARTNPFVSMKAAQYAAGRDLILTYYEENPKAVFAVGQASKYLLMRMHQMAEVA